MRISIFSYGRYRLKIYNNISANTYIDTYIIIDNTNISVSVSIKNISQQILQRSTLTTKLRYLGPRSGLPYMAMLLRAGFNSLWSHSVTFLLIHLKWQPLLLCSNISNWIVFTSILPHSKSIWQVTFLLLTPLQPDPHLLQSETSHLKAGLSVQSAMHVVL